MRVLVVDDQPNVRRLLSGILRRRAGCTVSEAANGLEALDLLGRLPFDLVVLDVLMPLMDGVDALAAIRRSPSLRHLPVIVLSAVRDERKVRQLVRHGISAYLAKPLRPHDVADRLEEIIARLAIPSGRTSPAPAPGPRVLADPSDLRPQMVSATEQVFGMMLGIDVLAVAEAPLPAPGDDIVRVPLRRAHDDRHLEFTLAAPRAMSERMTAQYLQAGDLVTDDDVSVTLSEMATIISSRLQTTLRQRGDEVTLGQPAFSRIEQVGPCDVDGLCVSYASAAQDLRFMTAVRGVPAPTRSPDVPAAPASAARTLRMDPVTPLPPPVDPEVLEMLASLQEPGEPDLIVELVTLFLRDTPARLRDLRVQPLEAGTAARVAHAVKGSAGNLGASGLQEVASVLEQAGHRGDGAAALAPLVDAMFEEYARVEQYLQGVLADRAGTDSPLRGC